MIQITYQRDCHRLTVQGHAGSAPAGQDLVCAAVSVLTYTLADAAENLLHNGSAKSATAQLGSGNAQVVCSPYPQFGQLTTVIFDAICAGYSILAADYPDCVSFKIQG